VYNGSPVTALPIDSTTKGEKSLGECA
jgi:hypothetical protein